MKAILPSARLGCALLLLASAARGEEAAGNRRFQNTAPEIIRIAVEDVNRIDRRGLFASSSEDIVIHAKVTQVLRSASGLAPGREIEIRYRRRYEAGGAAESPLPPAPGAEVPAFLSGGPQRYKPAARQLSFSEMSPEQEVQWAGRRPTQPPVRFEAPEVRPAAPALAPEPPVPAGNPPPAPAPPDEPPLPAVETTPPRAEPVTPQPLPPAPATRPPPLPAAPAPVLAENAQPGPVTEPIDITPVTPAPENAPAAPDDAPAPDTAPAPSAPASVEDSPLNRYARVYSLIQEGDQNVARGKGGPALEKYTRAREKLLVLQRQHPDFQPFMVQYRLRDLERKLESLGPPPPPAEGGAK